MEQDAVRELRTLPGVVYRCAHDTHWTMQLLSDEIEVVTGFPAISFIGNRDRSFASVIHPDDHDRVAREINQQLAEQDDFACEYRIIRADDRIVWILERGRRVRTGGQPAALLDGLLCDITDRKRAQEELRASVAEQAAYRAVAEERINVVRELHDSLGHALSVISLYAGITATQLLGDPQAAAATTQTIRDDASVTVRVVHGAATVTIEVVNDRPSAPSPSGQPPQAAGSRAGRGLTGLKHRVNEHGGKLTTEAQPQGGFSLTAVMPFGEDGSRAKDRTTPRRGPSPAPI